MSSERFKGKANDPLSPFDHEMNKEKTKYNANAKAKAVLPEEVGGNREASQSDKGLGEIMKDTAKEAKDEAVSTTRTLFEQISDSWTRLTSNPEDIKETSDKATQDIREQYEAAKEKAGDTSIKATSAASEAIRRGQQEAIRTGKKGKEYREVVEKELSYLPEDQKEGLLSVNSENKDQKKSISYPHEKIVAKDTFGMTPEVKSRENEDSAKVLGIDTSQLPEVKNKKGIAERNDTVAKSGITVPDNERKAKEKMSSLGEKIVEGKNYTASRAQDAKESAKDTGKYLSNKSKETKDYLSEKSKEGKDYVNEKTKEGKDYLSEKSNEGKGMLAESKDYIMEKGKEAKDFVAEKAKEGKDYISEKTHNILGSSTDDVKEKAKEGKDYMSEKSKKGKGYLSEKSQEGKDYINEKGKKGKDYLSEKSQEGKDYINEKGKKGKDYLSEKSMEGKDYVNEKAKEGKDYLSEKSNEGKGMLAESKDYIKEKGKEATDYVAEKAKEGKDYLSEKSHDLFGTSQNKGNEIYNKSKDTIQDKKGKARDYVSDKSMEAQEELDKQLRRDSSKKGGYKYSHQFIYDDEPPKTLSEKGNSLFEMAKEKILGTSKQAEKKGEEAKDYLKEKAIETKDSAKEGIQHAKDYVSETGEKMQRKGFEKYQESKDYLENKAEKAKDKGKEAKDYISDKAEKSKEYLQDKSKDARDYIRDKSEKFGEKVSEAEKRAQREYERPPEDKSWLDRTFESLKTMTPSLWWYDKSHKVEEDTQTDFEKAREYHNQQLAKVAEKQKYATMRERDEKIGYEKKKSDPEFMRKVTDYFSIEMSPGEEVLPPTEQTVGTFIKKRARST